MQGVDTLGSVAERLLGEVPELLSEHRIPGAAVGVCHRSGAAWSAGFGVLAQGSAAPVTTETMFSVQSISKVYTATTVMLAVQAGLLDLDVPVTAYLPEFTVNSRWEASPERLMTLRHLLSHTAGFTHEAPLGGNFDSRDSSFEEHCRSISDTWLRFPVGHHYEYSNLGIDLAAYAVQRVGGMSFPSYARRALLAPLGLDRTTFDFEEIARESDRAVGHSPPAEHVPVRVPMVGAGGVYTSVDGAVRFLRFLLGEGEDVLRKDVLDEMYRIPDPLPGQRFGYGLGVVVSRWNDRRVLTHSGGGFGFLSDLVWDPEAGFGVVVLTNSEDHPLQVQLASGILRDLTGREPSAPDGPSVVPLLDLADVAGEYVGRGGRVISIPRDNEQRYRFLAADKGPGRSYLVDPDGGATFYRNDPPPLPADAPTRTYVIEYLAHPAATLHLRTHGDLATLECEGEMAFPPLRLTRHAPGLYFCAMGEALDLTTDPPTYANIPLHPSD